MVIVKTNNGDSYFRNNDCNHPVNKIRTTTIHNHQNIISQHIQNLKIIVSQNCKKRLTVLKNKDFNSNKQYNKGNIIFNNSNKTI